MNSSPEAMAMDFALSEEQQLIRATTRAFVEAEMLPHEAEVDRLGEVPAELGRHIQQRAIAAGLYAANLPQSVGGGGLDYRAMAVVEREYGKTSHALHSWVGRPTELLLACRGEQVARYLTPCVRAEKRELFALTEPEAGSDIMAMKTNARRVGGDWLLNGYKHFISGPVMPEFAIVFAVTGTDATARGERKRITAFLVDVGSRGFEIAKGNRCVSYRGYHTFQLRFDDVRLGAEQVLGEEGGGLALAGKWLGMGRVWVGASCCGKAERLYHLSAEWAANRRQFGKPIGEFQATGFRLADMAIGIRTGDLLVSDAVARADADNMRDTDAAMVKVYCSEMLGAVADAAVQIHGGMGLMEELPVQRLWRDARLERIWDGTSEIQRHIITRDILRGQGGK